MGSRAFASTSLTPSLANWARRIEEAARGHGLDFFPLKFHCVDASDVHALAALGGFPVRYPSWRFGMEYERLEKAHGWGQARIYELVINTDPVVAWLVRSNVESEQKLVMAHVCGHADFFRHNTWFAGTDRNMLATMARHAERMREHIERHGQERVERFLDGVLCLDNLLDPYRDQRSRWACSGAGTLTLPTYDVLAWLVEHAPLEDWERDATGIVLAEARYFLPQRLTRIVNEGWACYWHSRILTGGVLDASEIIDFADCHSGATQQGPGRINPYKLGLALWRHAERRGDDLFRLRSLHDDASFVDALVDEEFVASGEIALPVRTRRAQAGDGRERDPRHVKERLLSQLAWGGAPRIELVEAQRTRDLRLVHRHDGRDLNLERAGETLARVESLWRAPVVLETIEKGSPRQLRCSGGRIERDESDGEASIDLAS
ncbi:MAG: SpoVR family protein [Planctomycetes bacterium]|nr:SpoVR family protein [Planctomycetota bacterium]MBM3992317.1 SpoVR family protein [Planctomycetota bacterium]